MKKLINKVENIVQEMCDGIVASSNKKLKKLKEGIYLNYIYKLYKIYKIKKFLKIIN